MVVLLGPPGWARVPLSRRVWPKVPAITTARGCREWAGKRRGNGYGVLVYAGKEIPAHRAVYELIFGPIPHGMFVCHHCDNPPCCEIAHLFLGTHLDNMADMRNKGRGPIRERHGGAKLTEAQVAEIRLRYIDGEGYKRLGRAFEVDPSNIRWIVKGKTWSCA